MKRYVALGLTVLMMAVIGCSPKTSSPSTKSQSPLTIALGAGVRSLIPMKILDVQTEQQLGHIYDTLIVRDPKTYQFAPYLAESWRIVDDLTWEFKLKKGVKFHNGEEFTAESIKVTLETVLDPKFESHYKSRLDFIKGIETPDPYTVILKTERPTPILLARIADLMPMPPKLVKEKGVDALLQTPTGVGAYKFVKHVKDERLELIANPDYWGGKPQIEKVIFKPIPEFSTRLSSLLAGEVDLIQGVPGHAVDQVNKSGKAVVKVIPSSRNNFIAMPTYKPNSPFKDVRVRQAMNYAVDVDSLIKYVMNGRATRTAGILTDVNPETNKALKPYPFDVAKAKQLLQEAGVDPTKLTLTLDGPIGRYPMDKEIVEAVAAELNKNLGMKVNVALNEWGTHLDKIVKHNTGELYMQGWGPSFDAEGVIGELMVAKRTYASFGDPELEKLIDAARPIMDPANRKAAWGKIQEEEYKQAPWIFLWQQHDLFGVNKRIEFEPRADERIDAWRMKIKD